LFLLTAYAATIQDSDDIDAGEKEHRQMLRAQMALPDDAAIKKGCHRRPNRTIVMQCVGACGEWLLRTTKYFYANGKEWDNGKPGFERLMNYESRPCRVCSNANRNSNVNGAFVKNLVGKRRYKNHGFTETVFYTKWTAQNGLGYISGLPMSKRGPRGEVPYQVNICRINNDLPHTPENCFLDIGEINPQQSKELIPCLKTAYHAIFAAVDLVPDDVDVWRQNFKNTSKENGVKAHSRKENAGYKKQRRNLHLKEIVSGMVNSHVQSDLKKRKTRDARINFETVDKETYLTNANKAVEDFLFASNLQCYFSFAALTIINGPRRFSLDRINNDLSHFGKDGKDTSNLRLVCRVFNTSSGMTREIFQLLKTSMLDKKRIEDLKRKRE